MQKAERCGRFRLRPAALGLVLGLLAACQKSAPPASKEDPKAPSDVVLSVLGVNDLHGRLLALPVFAGYVEALRKTRKDPSSVMVVDAGDMFQGTLGANLTEGRAVIEAYNAFPLTAAAVGNHEFDYGPLDGATDEVGKGPQGTLRTRLREARFPMLSSNLIDEATGKAPAWEGLETSVVVEAAGVKVGILGGLTLETESVVMPAYFQGLDVGPLAPAITREAKALRARGAEVVIGVIHAGAKCKSFDEPHDLSSCERTSREIIDALEAVPEGLVDAVIAGHTHAGVAHFVKRTAVVEAFSRGGSFSRVDLRVGGQPRRVLSAKPFPPETLCKNTAELAPCPIHDYAGRHVAPNPRILGLVQKTLLQAERERARPVGVEIDAKLDNLHDRECALGNLFADLMREAAGADVGLSNGGSLRAPLPKGPLSRGALYEAMPFENRLVTVSLRGSQLREILERHLSTNRHGMVSLSGVRAQARCEKGKLRVLLQRSSGRPIRDTEKLTLATSDYLASGGDHDLLGAAAVPSLAPSDSLLVREALARGLARLGRVAPEALFDARKPRLDAPSLRPVVCKEAR